jgi:endonuclease/exonuclease/phosphatase family metal-dependent hydrolase
MYSKQILFVLALWSIVSIGQTRIKAMTFNLMHYPSTLYYNDATNTFIDRTPVLKGILDTFQPDLFMVCELESASGSDLILQNALQTIDNRYNRANFSTNQSANDDSLQQLVFYNSQKLTLYSQDIIITDTRDINHYSFQLNAANAIYLEVFVAHLKSSTGSDNENKRLQMVQQFTNYLANLPTDRYVIFSGDFNLYKSSETAYQEIIDPTNHIVMVDPINSPGNWSNNSTFAAIHTQSPLTTHDQFKRPNGSWDGVTGGMDDRFDFMMVSQNMINGTNLKYVPNTYKAYGNNGNCYNLSINNSDCSGTYSQELRNLIFNMSDHLPVVMELETPYSLNVHEFTNPSFVYFNSSNIENKQIELSISENLMNTEYAIFNQLGQKVETSWFYQTNQRIDISAFSDGVYYIKTANTVNNLPLKFIKI